VTRFRFLVEVPDTRDVRRVAVRPGPVDGFVLRFESFEHMVGVIFDHIIVNRTSFRAAFGARLDVNIRHLCIP
jgi:hypothetical protein